MQDGKNYIYGGASPDLYNSFAQMQGTSSFRGHLVTRLIG